MKEKKSSYFTATWKMLAAVIIGGIAGGVSVVIYELIKKGIEAGRGRADRYGGCMGLSENISDHILCCICDEQTGVYQCRDSVGIYAEYDYERRPGAGKPSGIYQR